MLNQGQDNGMAACNNSSTTIKRYAQQTKIESKNVSQSSNSKSESQGSSSPDSGEDESSSYS